MTDAFGKPRQKRPYATKRPGTESYLIVTEGTKTEPLYFQGLRKAIHAHRPGEIEIAGYIDAPALEISGEGKSTRKLVEKAQEHLRKSKVFYQHVWIVFDKDDFRDFDEAIAEAQRAGFSCGWSNESFEYWLYLHFAADATHRTRWDWLEKLNRIFRDRHIGRGRYFKNDEALFEHVGGLSGAARAVAHAEERMRHFTNRTVASGFNPGTTVHHLVGPLLEYARESGADFAQDEDAADETLEYWSFPDELQSLNALVLSGMKTATCSLKKLYGPDDEVPTVGESILVDRRGRKLAKLRTDKVLEIRFQDVTEELAKLEGEGDLEAWRQAHRTFFREEARRASKNFSETDLLYFEVFRVLHRYSDRDASRRDSRERMS